MRPAAILLLATAGTVVSISFLFALAQHVVHNDQRLFEAQDRQRETMLARACGARAALWRNTDTGEYACRLTNPDGAQLLYQVDDQQLRYASN